MKLDLNHAHQLVADMIGAATGGADVPIERQRAHVALIRALPQLVEIALAAESLTSTGAIRQAHYDELVAKLQAFKELP